MPMATVGGIWQNPERKKLFGGSEAFVYIIDGFTVAHIIEPGYSDRERVEKGFDLAIFLPTDDSRTTPHTRVRDFDDAEQVMTRLRADHPDWPTEPVPLTVYVPELKDMSKAREHVVEISEVLEAGDYDFHGASLWLSALLMLVHCPRHPINQRTIDRAWRVNTVLNELRD